MTRHELHFQDGVSDKFWTIELQGKRFTVQFGRTGTDGQTQTKKFASNAEAEKACEKLVAEKLKKGYSKGKPKSAKSAKPVKKVAAKKSAKGQKKSKGMYDDAVAFLARVEDPEEHEMNDRERFSAKQLAQLQRDFPGIPDDFIAYLREVGAGSFRECQFEVFQDFLTPEDRGIDPPDGEEHSEEVLLFGHDFSEYSGGFLPRRRWAVVLMGNGGHCYKVKKPFAKFIRGEMLMGPRGVDLRE